MTLARDLLNLKPQLRLHLVLFEQSVLKHFVVVEQMVHLAVSLEQSLLLATIPLLFLIIKFLLKLFLNLEVFLLH